MICAIILRECGCGEGDAGCTICGCCRICAREVEDNSELAILGPNGAGDIAGMMRLDVIFGIGGIGNYFYYLLINEYLLYVIKFFYKSWTKIK